VLVDRDLRDFQCEDILRILQQTGTGIPCIVLQPRAPELTEVDVFRAMGACDVVCKYAYPQIVEVVTGCLAGGRADAEQVA
jgi:hypothetical protein